MHKAIRKELKKFRDENEKMLSCAKIAELGALNMNGSPREYLPIDVGFDIAPGNGVDIVIKPGVIPVLHRFRYDIVISSSSFHYCPRPLLYKKQILTLLKKSGVVWMSMCGPKCKRNHSTSDNEFGFKDCFRVTKKELKRFMEPEIECFECYYAGDDHHQDIIFIGGKTEKKCGKGVLQYHIPKENFRK